jgi:hypothetical protein
MPKIEWEQMKEQSAKFKTSLSSLMDDEVMPMLYRAKVPYGWLIRIHESDGGG